MTRAFSITGIIVLLIAARLSHHERGHTGDQDTMSRRETLIPDTAGMDRAWDLPRDPLVDSLPPDSQLAAQIVYGFQLFMKTGTYAPGFVGNEMSCNHCHANGGQRDRFMPLVGVASVFPEYNRRAGRLFSLEDRIVGCFQRSLNSTGVHKDSTGGSKTGLSTESREVLAIAAYLTWLSRGYAMGSAIPWRGRNVISRDRLIPIDRLDPDKGREIFLEKCRDCHGEGGEGIEIGDRKPGPLWGPGSWNDGAGAARTYTLAGMIRYAMPYLAPGSLSDEEAQEIAAYITSQPRPHFPYKDRDYTSEKIPIDAVYYDKLYARNPLQERMRRR